MWGSLRLAPNSIMLRGRIKVTTCSLYAGDHGTLIHMYTYHGLLELELLSNGTSALQTGFNPDSIWIKRNQIETRFNPHRSCPHYSR